MCRSLPGKPFLNEPHHTPPPPELGEMRPRPNCSCASGPDVPGTPASGGRRSDGSDYQEKTSLDPPGPCRRHADVGHGLCMPVGGCTDIG